jgi:hypothetical protein
VGRAKRGHDCNKVSFFSLKTTKHPKMKKIALIVSMLLTFAGMTMAQTTPATKPATTTTPATTHLKKDGTPDKRFKENKTPPPQHLKKDGTPDMRYKDNKTKPTTTTSPTATTPKKP